MNPLIELEQLCSLFPEAEGEQLYLSAEHIAREATPEPYHRMLVHEHHMTVTLPDSAMHSFQSPHNAIVWKVNVEGQGKGWRTFLRSFPLIVAHRRPSFLTVYAGRTSNGDIS